MSVWQEQKRKIKIKIKEEKQKQEKNGEKENKNAWYMLTTDKGVYEEKERKNETKLH